MQGIKAVAGAAVLFLLVRFCLSQVLEGWETVIATLSVISAATFYLVHSLAPSSVPPISSSSTPEIGEAPENEIALALAGGSLRAASSCFGVMRGLHQKKVISPTGKEVPAMNLVAYNSGTSGGSIPTILYSYARVSTEELLETSRSSDPSEITAELLCTMPKTAMGFICARKKTLVQRILHLFPMVCKVLFRPLTNYFRTHSLWHAGIYKIALGPLKVQKDKFFTSSKKELDEILKDNPLLKEEDFLVPRQDTTTLPMILVTMHGERSDKIRYETKYRKIYSKVFADHTKAGEVPDITEKVLSARNEYDGCLPMPYVVTADCVENKYSGMVQFEGNEVEFPERNVKPLEWGVEDGRYGRRARFSVEVLCSMSTNFVGTTASKTSQVITGVRKLYMKDNSVRTLRIADGGTSDLFAIVPLVARGTKNIISIYNFNQNPDYATGFQNTYSEIYRAANATSFEDPEFDKKFEEWIKHINPRLTCFFGFFSNIKPTNSAIIMNHIFHDPGQERLRELMIKYNSLFEAGEPLIATLKDLKVIDNPFWSIKGGKTVDLTIVWFSMPKKFSQNVPIEAVPPPKGQPKIDDDGRFTNDEFRIIPELPCDGTEFLTYSNEQINMMGYLGSWMVNHSWGGLKDRDGKVQFDGFGRIFGE